MRSTHATTVNRSVILLAEDDENDLVLLRRALQRLEMVDRLIVVSNGEEALAYLQGEGRYAERSSYPLPDVILLDYRMPRLSGLAVLCWLRSEMRFENLPVVLLSGAFSPAQIETATRMRAATCTKVAVRQLLADTVQESVRTAFALVRRNTIPALPVLSPASRHDSVIATRVWT